MPCVSGKTFPILDGVCPTARKLHLKVLPYRKGNKVRNRLSCLSGPQPCTVKIIRVFRHDIGVQLVNSVKLFVQALSN